MAMVQILIVPYALLRVFNFKVKAAPVVVFGVIHNMGPKTVYIYITYDSTFGKHFRVYKY